MKNLTKILLIVIIAIIASCAKEGPAGTNGNSNVIVFRYEDDFTLTSSATIKYFYPTGLTAGMVDSGLVLGFYKPPCSGNWLSCTGLGCTTDYQTRGMVLADAIETQFHFRIYDVDGTSYSGTDKIISDFKIIAIAASTVINGRTRNPRTMSYEEVCDLYHIPK